MIEKVQPILITGCARSGTSLIAGTINRCGAFGGIMSPPNKNNMKGMYENIRIRNDIVKPYLRTLGVDPLGQYPLPDVKNLPLIINLKKSVERIMIEEGYKNGKWMYKGAKLCLIWPLWHSVFPDAKWIIVRRKTSDIINSCIKTGFMRAFSKELNQKAVGADNEKEGWLWWVHQHEKRFIEMIEAGVNYKEVWPERMVTGDYRQIYEVIEWLGLKWNKEVLTFIDSKLWKARKGVNNG